MFDPTPAISIIFFLVFIFAFIATVSVKASIIYFILFNIVVLGMVFLVNKPTDEEFIDGLIFFITVVIITGITLYIRIKKENIWKKLEKPKYLLRTFALNFFGYVLALTIATIILLILYKINLHS